jgi:hypothetical protein
MRQEEEKAHCNGEPQSPQAVQNPASADSQRFKNQQKRMSGDARRTEKEVIPAQGEKGICHDGKGSGECMHEDTGPSKSRQQKENEKNGDT